MQGVQLNKFMLFHNSRGSMLHMELDLLEATANWFVCRNF
jgi:hypothetical protein